MKRMNIFLSLLALLTLSVPGAQAETLTYKDLVQRLTDLDHLSILPPDGEKTSLASSYDRASQYDATNDKYIHWNANYDANGIIRKEGDSVVLAEMTGPGCIWRIWSAAPKAGHVKIYLDGNPVPTIDLPFTGYFDGKTEPFTRPNLVYHTGLAESGQEGGGWNNYTPIPFRKSCKIVADPNWGAYYHFNYTQFAPGTVVPTFDPHLSADVAGALDEVDKRLGRCGEDPSGSRKGQMTSKPVTTVAPGETTAVLDLTGPQAITGLKVKLDLPSDPKLQRQFLRQMTMQITWDDDATPAVWAPLGDFFGFVGGGSAFKTLPTGFTDAGFYSYWYMPFASRAKLEVTNESDHPVTLTWEIDHAPLDKPIADLGRFHAKWHRDAFLPKRADRWPDWTLLSTQGRGRFVGTNLHVWCANSDWWGEGDEKFFIDGEKFPSTFGTGSEDYFGYAWGRAELFSRPFHSQSLNTNNRGHIDDNRWHITDNVPFQKSFEGSLEKYFPNANTRYAAVAYWYLDAGGHDSYSDQTVEDRTEYWTAPVEVSGVIKGEAMTILGKPHEVIPAQVRFTSPYVWSGDSEFVWRADAVGDHLDLQFPVEKAGTYRVSIRPALDPSSGMVRLSLDGKEVGAPLDLLGRENMPSDAVYLATLKLAAGNHVLGVTVTGNSPPGTKFFFAFDWLRLQSVK